MQDWARGPPTSRASGGLPLPTGSGFPSPGRVVTSGRLQAGSRCAEERWTGMRLWGRTPPSSGRCQLAPRLRGLCGADELLRGGHGENLRAKAANICWAETPCRGGSPGVSFHLGRVQRADRTHTPLFQGHLESVESRLGHWVGKYFPGRKNILGWQCRVGNVTEEKGREAFSSVSAVQPPGMLRFPPDSLPGVSFS